MTRPQGLADLQFARRMVEEGLQNGTFTQSQKLRQFLTDFQLQNLPWFKGVLHNMEQREHQIHQQNTVPIYRQQYYQPQYTAYPSRPFWPTYPPSYHPGFHHSPGIGFQPGMQSGVRTGLYPGIRARFHPETSQGTIVSNGAGTSAGTSAQGDQQPSQQPQTSSIEPSPKRQRRGPDHYTLRKMGQRKFKDGAVEITYDVALDKNWEGEKLKDIEQDIKKMFQDVLDRAKTGHKDADRGRVVLHHPSLKDPIVVSLRKLDELDADVVMGAIEKTLNSNESVDVTAGFKINVGIIENPYGSGPAGNRSARIRPMCEADLKNKRSVLWKRYFDDNLCLHRAVALAFATATKVTNEEFNNINLQLQRHEKMLATKSVPEYYYRKMLDKSGKGPRELTNFAIFLAKKAGVRTDTPGNLDDLEKYKALLNFHFNVVDMDRGMQFITPPNKTTMTNLWLILHDHHFGTITSISGFFRSNDFCETCYQPVDHKDKHKCSTGCIVCESLKCSYSKSVTCNQCNRECRSGACLTRHLSKKICNKTWQCPDCKTLVNLLEKDRDGNICRTKKSHICGEYLCYVCKQYVTRPHLCFMRNTRPKKNDLRTIYFDFECRQDEAYECSTGYHPWNKDGCKVCSNWGSHRCSTCRTCMNCKKSNCGYMEHKPNLVVAQSSCRTCSTLKLTAESTCLNCGSRCPKCWKWENDTFADPPCDGCGLRQVSFSGDDTLEKFGAWLFNRAHSGYRVMAHNLKGYDGYYLMDYAIRKGLKPKDIIFTGSKLMTMTIGRGLDIKLLDSLNYLPMPLVALPKTFGLDNIKKGYFPHFFNTLENWNYIGPYPAPEYYGVDQMSAKDLEAFNTWYKSVQGKVFDFQKELFEYCVADVDILRRAFDEFVRIVAEATELPEADNEDNCDKDRDLVAVDARQSITIASVSMAIFKGVFLKEKLTATVKQGNKELPLELIEKQHGRYTYKGKEIKSSNLKNIKFIDSPIAHVPAEGLVKRDQFSKVSIEWLEWISYKEGIVIEHALNVGEKSVQVGRSLFKLDGYSQNGHTAYEFLGCAYHGCRFCYTTNREGTIFPNSKESIAHRYALTKRKELILRKQGYQYREMWECEFRKMKSENKELQEFVAQLDMVERLDVRKSFFGGRCNAVQLHYKVKDGEKIKYVDFTSLYPYINKYARYPVGHPEIITKNFRPIKNYFGIAKVKVLPPTDLYHPVLPYTSNGKLKFPLCAVCADKETQGPCPCSDEDRAMVGEWCTPELNTAVECGYKILKIYEVYHWPESTQYDRKKRKGGLFADYVNMFLKFKQEASGWPEWCKTEEDKRKYVADYLEHEGVELDPEQIKKNPGLRAVAKLALNSLWGRFAMRNDKTKTVYFNKDEAGKFFQMVFDLGLDILNFRIISEDVVQLEYREKKDFIPDNSSSNIYIGTFTTCYARLKLLSVLHQLGRAVLYYDTDSCVYVSRPGVPEPELNDYLGDLTDELGNGDYIVEFVSAGPKNYAYRTFKRENVCKVRGFSLNNVNQKIINFDAVKELVFDTSRSLYKVVTNKRKIVRDKITRKLLTCREDKKYKFVYTKRIILPNNDTIPYGFERVWRPV